MTGMTGEQDTNGRPNDLVYVLHDLTFHVALSPPYPIFRVGVNLILAVFFAFRTNASGLRLLCGAKSI
jgi:hypothetical protein